MILSAGNKRMNSVNCGKYPREVKGRLPTRNSLVRPNPKRVKNDKAMAAAVTKEVDKRFAAARKDKEDATPAPTKDEARAYIMALLEDNTKKAEISGSIAKPKTVTLKSIISKAKNAKS
jgi:hypothetical protein